MISEILFILSKHYGNCSNEDWKIIMNLKLDEDYLYLYNKTLVKNIENKLSQFMVAEGTQIKNNPCLPKGHTYGNLSKAKIRMF